MDPQDTTQHSVGNEAMTDVPPQDLSIEGGVSNNDLVLVIFPN